MDNLNLYPQREEIAIVTYCTAAQGYRCQAVAVERGARRSALAGPDVR